MSACAIGAALAAGPARAQAPIVTDGTMGARVELNGPAMQIPHTLGTQAGTNLFHSFQRFNVPTGSNATFTGPGGTDNVISRVTGGEASTINGAFRSTVPGAAVWFTNPAGVTFGPNASLDVPASFHASTADEIRFPDGGRFSADLGAASTLSVAAPAAFGFLSGGNGGIEVDGTQFAVDNHLSLVGGQVDIKNDAILVAIDGNVNLLARDNITVSGSTVVALSIERGAGVRIRAGTLLMDNSQVLIDNIGKVRGGELNIEANTIEVREGALLASRAFDSGRGGDITIQATSVGIGSDGHIQSVSRGGGDAGSIVVKADRITIRGPEFFDERRLVEFLNGDRLVGITSDSMAGSTGAAGSITASTREIDMSGFGVISSSTRNTRDAGSVTVHSGHLTMSGDLSIPMIRAIALEGSTGNAGTVIISAEKMDIRGGLIATQTLGARDATPDSTGAAGKVVVKADSIHLTTGGQIGSSAFGLGDGGDVEVRADREIRISGSDVSGSSSGVFATAGDSGLMPGRSSSHGGNITMQAPLMILEGGADVSSSSWQNGPAGKIVIETKNLILENSRIETKGQIAGGGQIEIFADLISAQNSEISSIILGGADTTTGDITTDSRFLVLDNSHISAQVLQGTGGNIRIVADHIFRSPESVISASSFLGLSGTVNISSAETDVTGNLAQLPGDVVNAAGQMQERCAVRGGVEGSSFTIAGPEALSPALEGYLAGTYAGVADETAAATDGSLMVALGGLASPAWTVACGEAR